MPSPPQHLHQIQQLEPYADQLQYDDGAIKDEIFDSDADLQETGSMLEQSNIDGIVIKPIPCDDDFDDLIKIHSNNGGGMRQPLQYHQMTIADAGEVMEQHQQPPIAQQTVAEKKKKAKEDREKGVLHTCVVCSRAFKNPNALEKHLRTVHTVNVLTTIMPAAGGSHNNVLKLDAMPGGVAGSAYKTYKDSRKTVLHTSTPIKPSIAKALANKLTEKNNKRLLESAAGGGVSPNSEYQPQYESYQIETLNVSPTSQQQLQQFEYAEVGSPTGATTSSGAGGPGNNGGNNTIIIISNVELNNSLIDTSQLFVNQDLKLYNPPASVQDDLPKLVPISSAKCNSNMYANLTSSKAEELNPESPQLFVIPKDKAVPYNCGGDAATTTLIKVSLAVSW
jgi:Zinc finger, C2H2 type